MRIIALSEDSFRNLILTGSPYYPLENFPELEEMDDEQAITLLVGMAKNKPKYFIEILKEVNYYNANGINGMTALAVAVFLASASDYIKQNSEVKSYIYNLMFEFFKPEDLMIIVDSLRSKYFGKGLGSFEQKMIKKVMERWSYDTIKICLETDPTNFRSLLRLIHPKYSDRRGKLIRSLE